MPLRPLKTFFPDADDIANCELPTLGATLLAHLKSYEGLNTVYQYAGLNRTYFRAMLENHNVGLGPMPKESEYGPRQAEVAQAMLEAFNWLVREGHLIPNSQQPTGDWFTISRSGEKLLQQQARETQWEKLGVDVVKQDLLNGGMRFVGGPQENRQAALEWVRRKENKPPKAPASPRYMTLVSESRIDEMRVLS